MRNCCFQIGESGREERKQKAKPTSKQQHVGMSVYLCGCVELEKSRVALASAKWKLVQCRKRQAREAEQEEVKEVADILEERRITFEQYEEDVRRPAQEANDLNFDVTSEATQETQTPLRQLEQYLDPCLNRCVESFAFCYCSEEEAHRLEKEKEGRQREEE